MPKAARLSRRTIYRSPWITLHADKVRLPTGRIIDRFHILDFELAAVGVIVENSRGQILLERMHRYPTGTTGWEIPAGSVERRESPLAGAQREVFEETGYRTRNPKLLYKYFPMNGSSNKIFYLVKCRAGRQTGPVDPDEVAGIRWFSKKELWMLMKKKKIHDGLTLTALLFL